MAFPLADHARPSAPRRQRGLSLVETMVGLTVGLVVTAAASSLMVGQLGSHRRMSLETQVQQDLRAVADLIQRDLRRASTRLQPEQAVWTPSQAASANAYADLTVYSENKPVAVNVTGNQIRYRYPRTGISDPSAPSSADIYGFRLEEQRLEFLLGDRWQPLTDDSIMKVTQFEVRLNEQPQTLSELCDGACPSTIGCQVVRRVDIALGVESSHDSTVQRHVTLSTRVRADVLQSTASGSCT